MPDKTLDEALSDLGKAIPGNHPAASLMSEVWSAKHRHDEEQQLNALFVIGAFFASAIFGLVLSGWILGNGLRSGTLSAEVLIAIIEISEKSLAGFAIIGVVIAIWFIGYRSGTAAAALKKKRELSE